LGQRLEATNAAIVSNATALGQQLAAAGATLSTQLAGNVSVLSAAVASLNATKPATSALLPSINGVPSSVCNNHGYIFSPLALVTYCACYEGWTGIFCAESMSSSANLALQRPATQSSTFQRVSGVTANCYGKSFCQENLDTPSNNCGKANGYMSGTYCICTWQTYGASVAVDGTYTCASTNKYLVGPFSAAAWSNGNCYLTPAVLSTITIQTADSQSMTTAEASPWWTVDLGSYFAIGTVKVQSPSALLLKLEAVSYDANGVAYKSSCYAYPLNVTSAEPGVFTCGGLGGRFLTISIPGQTDQLNLCQVEVYALANPY
jgi:hypothetical protein